MLYCSFVNLHEPFCTHGHNPPSNFDRKSSIFLVRYTIRFTSGVAYFFCGRERVGGCTTYQIRRLLKRADWRKMEVYEAGSICHDPVTTGQSFRCPKTVVQNRKTTGRRFDGTPLINVSTNERLCLYTQERIRAVLPRFDEPLPVSHYFRPPNLSFQLLFLISNRTF